MSTPEPPELGTAPLRRNHTLAYSFVLVMSLDLSVIGVVVGVFGRRRLLQGAGQSGQWSSEKVAEYLTK